MALADAFVRQGWHVTVLTAPRQLFAAEGMVDISLSAQVPEGVQVIEVPFASVLYSHDVSEWSRSRARHPELWATARSLRFPEPGFGDWRSALIRAAERAHRETPFDLTIGTASPSVDFIPGWHLKRRHGVPFLMDYRDAWTIDVFTGARQARAPRAAERWERRLLSIADQVWFVNEPIRDWHQEKYPDAAARMRVVPNGFDVVDGVSPAVRFTELDPSRPLTFGYVGTINNGQFPAEQLLDGWRRAREVSSEMARARIDLHGHLGRTGVADESLDRYLRRAAQHGITYQGPVAKADVASTYAGFDGLVLALASGPGVTSGKVFEFAATGLPVVSVHDPKSAASTIMAGSPVWVPSRSLSADDIAEAFVTVGSIIRAQSAQSRATAVRWGAKWERMRQLEGPVRDAVTLAERRLAT